MEPFLGTCLEIISNKIGHSVPSKIHKISSVILPIHLLFQRKMDLDCEESAYDAFEYESEGCDDPGAADEYENQMYATWTGHNRPAGYASYSGRDPCASDPRYNVPQYQSQYEDDTDCAPAESQAYTEVCSTGYSDLMDEYNDQDESACDFDTQDECEDDCGPPCGDPADQECPLPDPNVQCPPCKPIQPTCPDDTDGPGYGDNGANTICGKNLEKVNEIIGKITPFTVLDEFMLSIANYTADNGEIMFDVMSNEVSNFKELIKEIYANRNDAVSELLKAEQRQMKNKYEKWTRELNQKTEDTMRKIHEYLPDFDLGSFSADPSNYIYSAMMANFKKEQQTTGVPELTSLNADRNFRVALHKRTWLMREAERIECDNEERMCKLNEMMAQLACLSDGLATSNKKLAAYNRQLESHATCLRNKLAYNENVLNCLSDEIEINNLQADKKVEGCPIIDPDDILTPYPSGYDYC